MATNLNWRGQWTNSNTYQVGDAVFYLGSSYVAIDINTYVIPSANPLSWNLLAAQGETGPQGIPGIQGITGAGSPGPTGATGDAGATGRDSRGVTPIAPASLQRLRLRLSTIGASYICIADGTHNLEPDTNPSEWNVLSAAGAAGSAGSTGATGATGADGAAGAAGSSGSVTTLATSLSLPLSANVYNIAAAQTNYVTANDGTVGFHTGFLGGGPAVATGLIYCPGATQLISNSAIAAEGFGPGAYIQLFDTNGTFTATYPSGASSWNIPSGTAITLPGTQCYVRLTFAEGANYWQGAGTMIAVGNPTATLPGSFRQLFTLSVERD